MDLFSLILFCKETLKETIESNLVNEYAWRIVTTVFQKTKTELIINPPEVSPEIFAQIKAILFDITKRQKPIQYIIKIIPFLELEIQVEPPTLICRPETEQLCEYVIQLLQPYKNERLFFLDIGTGSGCIGLSIAQAFAKSTVYAVDISNQALDLAERNAKKNNINNIVFLQSDLFSNLDKAIFFDLIISNPPYIAKRDWQQLDNSVKKWEDIHALVANDNGYSILSSIIKQSKNYLHKKSVLTYDHQPQLVLEIGHSQGKRVQMLMQTETFSSATIWHDQYCKDRAVFGVL